MIDDGKIEVACVLHRATHDPRGPDIAVNATLIPQPVSETSLAEQLIEGHAAPSHGSLDQKIDGTLRFPLP